LASMLFLFGVKRNLSNRCIFPIQLWEKIHFWKIIGL
jgi:hypothetical protein